jgi:hypothetical protein
MLWKMPTFSFGLTTLWPKNGELEEFKKKKRGRRNQTKEIKRRI